MSHKARQPQGLGQGLRRLIHVLSPEPGAETREGGVLESPSPGQLSRDLPLSACEGLPPSRDTSGKSGDTRPHLASLSRPQSTHM